MKKQTTAERFEITERVFAWKVAFYDGGEKIYKSGAAALKFANKEIHKGHLCEIDYLTMDGWKQAAAC